MRLYCIPYAGGNEEFYKNWYFDKRIRIIPLLLRSRKNRMNLPYYNSICDAAEDCYSQIMNYSDITEDYCIFGHSMGAVIAYELYYVCLENLAPLPSILFLSGMNTPDCKFTGRILSTLEDEDLIKVMMPLGRTNIVPDKDLQHFYLQTLRKDLSLLERWEPDCSKSKIKSQVSILYSKEDRLIDVDNICNWNNFTEQKCRFHEFQGGHFYFSEHKNKTLLQILGREIEGLEKR